MLRYLRKDLERRDEGFTLIELLVVVIIIGILAAIAIPVFMGQRERAYRSALQSDLRNLATQAETFFTDGQTYVGFDTHTLFTDYDTSTGVRVEAANMDLTASTFCIEGRHDNLTGVVWVFDSDGSPQLQGPDPDTGANPSCAP